MVEEVARGQITIIHRGEVSGAFREEAVVTCGGRNDGIARSRREREREREREGERERGWWGGSNSDTGGLVAMACARVLGGRSGVVKFC